MNKMMIIHNHPDMRHLTSETVWFINDEETLSRAMDERDVRLAIGRFEGEIPTADRVDLYNKEDGNYIWCQTWIAPKSREQAIVDFYRNAGADVQKDFINKKVVDL